MSKRSRFLSCQNFDDVLSFHEARGFDLTCRQEFPNPYLCLKQGDLDIHFSAVAGYKPENSLGSLIVLASDGGVLFDQFAAGPKKRHGRLPVAGIAERARMILAEFQGLELTATEKTTLAGELAAAAEPKNYP